MLVVQARFRYTQNPCVGFLLVAGWCFQHCVRNPAPVNTRSKSLTINVMCWPQTWQRASSLALLVFVMLRAHADTGQRLWDLSDSFRISSHVSIEDVLFLPAVFMKKG